MSKTCVILVLLFAIVSCTLSSYLDIPPPPERPMRFKTKEQIETYLKAVKDYYDAFKIKLVRREDSLAGFRSSELDKSSNDDGKNNNIDEFNEHFHLLNQLHRIYSEKQLSRSAARRQQQEQQYRARLENDRK